MTDGTHLIVTDFGDADVRRKSDSAVPKCFRLWESVPEVARIVAPEWNKYVRRVNTTGYPPFDIFAEWLMDFATISSGQLGRADWENFRRMLLLHVPECRLSCWYCFNDAWLGGPKVQTGEMSAKAILAEFARYREGQREDGKELNVLRISGGEPFMKPGLIQDIAEGIFAINKPDRPFLWVDTNLYEIRQPVSEAVATAIGAIRKLKDGAAVHACIHGHKEETLKRNSGQSTNESDVKEALQVLVRANIQVYPRINPAALTPSEVTEIFGILRDASDGKDLSICLPLRTYLGPIELLYDPAINRMQKISQQEAVGATDRMPELRAANAAIFQWNRLLEESYGVGYGRIPRHMVTGSYPLMKPKAVASAAVAPKWEDVILLCKGWEKEVYAEKMLEALSVPEGAILEAEFENKWIDPGFLAYVFACPTFFKKRENLKVLVTCCHKGADPHRMAPAMVPLRWASLRSVSTTDCHSPKHSLILSLQMGAYANGLARQIPGDPEEALYGKVARYGGIKHLPFGGDSSFFCRLIGLELVPTTQDGGLKPLDQGFKQVVIDLVETKYEKAKRDIYFRVKSIVRVAKQERVTLKGGRISACEGEEIQLTFEACNPNLGNPGYPEVHDAQIRLASTTPERVQISPEHIQLSKYGEPTANLVFARKGEYTGDILIEPVEGAARIPSFRIPFHVEVAN